jgi:hypothetical protein
MQVCEFRVQLGERGLQTAAVAVSFEELCSQ